ncbi:hypothetical protein [Parvibaculum sp.]|uniref:hypothetical protein n=1 Tax=Parvibaculum sp. TaxID=2024848 RepID=UPI003298C6C8
MSRNGPESAAEKASSNMMRLGLVAVAMSGVIAFYVLTGRVELNDPVEVTARIAQPATWTANAPLTLNVAVTLANNTDEAMPLSLPSQCDIFRWFVADEDHNLVQSQRNDEPCLDVPMKGNLDAKTSISGEFTLTLDPARVKPGDYILFLRYWGYELREPVTID